MREKSNIQAYILWQRRAYVYRSRYKKYIMAGNEKRAEMLLNEVYSTSLRDFQKDEIVEIIKGNCEASDGYKAHIKINSKGLRNI